MNDDDNTRYSGSRWEPGPADQVPAEPTAPGATPGAPEPETHRVPVTPLSGPDPDALPPFPADPLRRSRRRVGLLAAAAAAGLLAVGGLGGYAIGSAAADTGAAAAGPGDAAGGYGHHRGPLGRDGGAARDGTGTGTTGAST